MTIPTYSTEHVTRLIAEAREDDEALAAVIPSCHCSTADLLIEGHAEGCHAEPAERARDKAQQRALANLCTLANQLEAAQRRIAELEPMRNALTHMEALAEDLDQGQLASVGPFITLEIRKRLASAVEDLRTFALSHGEIQFAHLCSTALNGELWAIDRLSYALMIFKRYPAPEDRLNAIRNTDTSHPEGMTDRTFKI